MATIYRADDRLRGGSVAVKVPLKKVENDPASFGRFQREERICSTLCGSMLLKFVPVDDAAKSRSYFVTEFLDGCTLAYVIHRRRPLPERDALRIASVACQALSQMHARRIIHRDVKPANIMICRNQRLCLLDFGLAAEADAGQVLLASMTPLFGTPEYMAPEQVRNKGNDERTDVYSLGVILYQMLTGVLPFPGDEPWVAAQRRVTGDPPAPRSVNPAITPQAEEIVLHALRRAPEDRYQTVSEFQAALDHPESVHVTGLSERLQAPRFRVSLLGTPILAGVLIGVGSVLALVGLFLLIMHHR